MRGEIWTQLNNLRTSAFHFNLWASKNKWFHCRELNRQNIKWSNLLLLTAFNMKCPVTNNPGHHSVKVFLLRCSPMTLSDSCTVRWSWPFLMCRNRKSGVWAKTVENKNPSRFQVRKWKWTISSSILGSTGRDRKLLLELRKEVTSCWGSEQEKATLPWERKKHEINNISLCSPQWCSSALAWAENKGWVRIWRNTRAWGQKSWKERP